MERFMTRFDLPGYDLHWSEYPGHYSEKDWTPLIQLVSKLAHLKSIHYAVANSFPRSLLDAVHHHHPSCEINIWSPQCLRLDIPIVNQKYTFNAFRQPNRVYNDTLDMEIIQSPCLRAIKIDYPLFLGSDGAFQPHSIIHHVSQAPSLKHIYLRLDSDWGIRFMAAIRNLPDKKVFMKWNQTLDFTTLRSLNLPRIECPSLFKDAASGFTSLERLAICVAPGRFGWAQISADLHCAFRYLRPLKYLSIGALEDVLFLHNVLERHGPSLMGLMLEPYESGVSRTSPPLKPEYCGCRYPFLDHEHLHRIAEHFQNLKVLRVPIRRSKGSEEEVRTYRSLSQFPQLQNLILDLYGNPRPVLSREEGQYSDEGLGDMIPVHVSLKDAFINFAVDRDLATAIWKEIFLHQPSRRLLRLRISPWGFDIFSWEEIYVFLQLAGSFLVTHGGNKVVEIGREERRAEQEAIAEEDEFEDRRPFRVPRRITQILHSIWQPVSSDTDWTTSWRSFPLQTDV
ncbi:hypothetical protein BJX96DRAFT_162071 [Aspergillus floccosus]